MEPFARAQKSLKSRTGKARSNEAGLGLLLFYIYLVSCDSAKSFLSPSRFWAGDVDSLEISTYSIMSSVNKSKLTYSFLDFFTGGLYFIFFPLTHWLESPRQC